MLRRIRQQHGRLSRIADRRCRSISQSAAGFRTKRARDVTGTKLLTLATACQAEFLVTNDRRHPLPLRVYDRTRIVTPTGFLREL